MYSLRRSTKLLCSALLLLASSKCVASTGQASQPLIHVYQSPAPGPVNTYWVEGPKGIVVLDTQRSLARAREALTRIQSSRKPVVAILISHPHDDHYGGLSVFASAYPNAPIFASKATADAIRSDPGGFFRMTKQRLGKDFPDRPTLPTRTIHDGETLHLAGLDLETQEFGVGEASSETVFYIRSLGALFVGDTIMDHVIPFIHEHSAEWLAQINRMSHNYPQARTLYPGHGNAGPPPTLLIRQADYLRTFRGVVAAQLRASNSALSMKSRQSVVDEMTSRYPDWPQGAPVPDLLGVDTDALARELAVH